MKRIGLRELRQNASRWLSRVAAGETVLDGLAAITITEALARLLAAARDAGLPTLSPG